MSKGILDVIHSDVWGPTQMATFSGCRYNVTFIDDFSRHTWIFPMWQKSEVFSHFQKFKNEVEKAINCHVRCLRADGGKEYFSDAFTTYLRQEGIQGEFTCPHEKFYGKKPDLFHVRIFGSIALVMREGGKGRVYPREDPY